MNKTKPYNPVHTTNAAPLMMHRGFHCPYCNTTMDPIHKGKTTQTGWIVFILLIFLCFPLAWVALFMREDTVTCSGCRMRLS